MAAERNDAVEDQMLKLLADAGLPEPDRVDHEETLVRFSWSDRGVSVTINKSNMAEMHFA